MSRNKIEYIGLDFETSTGDHRNLAPIQLGITYGEGIDFLTLIGGWDFSLESEHRWSEHSAQVHGIDQTAVEECPVRIHEADVRATSFIYDHTITARMSRVIVGWNVGSFDRRIVNSFMPNLNTVLSYRTLDLNTAVYLACDLLDASYDGLKRELKDKAADEIGAANWHDALFDAKAGLINYRDLCTILGSRMEKVEAQALK